MTSHSDNVKGIKRSARDAALFYLPETHLAWREVRQGLPDQCLELQKVRVALHLAPGECLVQVQAAGLSSMCLKFMQILPNAMAGRPRTTESDFTGVIIANQGFTGFEVGDTVCGWIPPEMSQKTGQGALSQFVRIRSDHIIKRPENINIIQGAGVCMAGLCAWQLLFNHAKITAGQSILINGGSGSIGTFAIQIAKANGCIVTATTSTGNMDFVKGLGADNVLDYTKCESIPIFLEENPPDPPFDAIIDCVANNNEFYTKCQAYLKEDGVLASVAPVEDKLLGTAAASATLLGHVLRPKWLGGIGRRFSLLSLNNSKDDLRGLEALLAQGNIIPVIDSVYKFDEVARAYERVKSNRARGKVVVAINTDTSY